MWFQNACCYEHAESMLYRVFWPVDTISGPQRPVGHLIRTFWPLSFIYLEKARQSFFSQTVEAKNMADFWRIWRHLTPFLWQRLKVVTANQAQFWARGIFRTPLVLIRWYFDFCSKFSYLSMGMIFYGFYLDFYDLIRCTSYSRYPCPWKGTTTW